MATLEETKAVWKRADAVCFDVDSTVSTEEAIDELAAHCGVGDEVAQWYGSMIHFPPPHSAIHTCTLQLGFSLSQDNLCFVLFIFKHSTFQFGIVLTFV